MTHETTIRVLIADGQPDRRRLLHSALSEQDDIDVVGAAGTGRLALSLGRDARPEVVVCPVQLPDEPAVSLLETLSAEGEGLAALLIDSQRSQAPWPVLTNPGSLLEVWTIAFPPHGAMTAGDVRRQAPLRVRALARSRQTRALLRRAAAERTNGEAVRPRASEVQSPARPRAPRTSTTAATTGLRDRQAGNVRAIVIGVSTGGPRALARLLPQLPADLSVPVLVVQHIPASFAISLARDLDAHCALPVRVSEDGEPIRPGRIHLAPGGRQFAVVAGANGPIARVCDDPKENSCRPAADYLFRSAAEVYGDGVLGIVMTGMGVDGLAGARQIRQAGGAILAQDEASCVIYGMSRAVIEAGLADEVLDLDDLVTAIVARTGQRVA